MRGTTTKQNVLTPKQRLALCHNTSLTAASLLNMPDGDINFAFLADNAIPLSNLAAADVGPVALKQRGATDASELVRMGYDALHLVDPVFCDGAVAAFGAASYPVVNSITDAGALADKFIEFIDAKVKPADASAVVNKAVDGLLAIPDGKVSEYAGVLKQVVYKGVSPSSCVTLGGSEAFAQKLQNSAAVKSVPSSKIDDLQKKFKPANSAVPVGKNGICLPGSVEASEKLWVAQAELTFSMPKAAGAALVSAIKTAGAQATRSSIATLVPAAEAVFSKSGEAIKMAAAGKAVEPLVISTANAATK